MKMIFGLRLNDRAKQLPFEGIPRDYFSPSTVRTRLSSIRFVAELCVGSTVHIKQTTTLSTRSHKSRAEKRFHSLSISEK